MICEKKKISFLIANADASNKQGTYWWSILNIEPITDIFFFDSFGFDGLKNFIILGNKKGIEKILFATEQMKKTDNKIILVNVDLILILVKT